MQYWVTVTLGKRPSRTQTNITIILSSSCPAALSRFSPRNKGIATCASSYVDAHVRLRDRRSPIFRRRIRPTTSPVRLQRRNFGFVWSEYPLAPDDPMIIDFPPLELD